MKRVASICVVCVFVFFIQVVQSKNDSLDYWSEVIQDNDFDTILAVFLSGPKEEWPAIHSVNNETVKNQSNEMNQAELRKLCELLAHGLEKYEQNLKDWPLMPFCQGCDALLIMRQHISNHASYMNLILTDSIDRVLYVNLAERLAREEPISPLLITLMKRVGQKSKPDLMKVRAMIGHESKGFVIDDVVFQAASEYKRLEILWSALSPDRPVLYVPNPMNCPAYTLFKTQDFLALLNRLAFSDFYIRTLIPALLDYREKAERFTALAKHQDIETVLGRETKAPESLGSFPFGISWSSSAVDTLLRDIRSGKTRRTLAFSIEKVLEEPIHP